MYTVQTLDKMGYKLSGSTGTAEYYSAKGIKVYRLNYTTLCLVFFSLNCYAVVQSYNYCFVLELLLTVIGQFNYMLFTAVTLFECNTDAD